MLQILHIVVDVFVVPVINDVVVDGYNLAFAVAVAVDAAGLQDGGGGEFLHPANTDGQLKPPLAY